MTAGRVDHFLELSGLSQLEGGRTTGTADWSNEALITDEDEEGITELAAKDDSMLRPVMGSAALPSELAILLSRLCVSAMLSCLVGAGITGSGRPTSTANCIAEPPTVPLLLNRLTSHPGVRYGALWSSKTLAFAADDTFGAFEVAGRGPVAAEAAGLGAADALMEGTTLVFDPLMRYAVLTAGGTNAYALGTGAAGALEDTGARRSCAFERMIEVE
jgi:hypothetical protein